MATKKRLIYVEDMIASLEKDIEESKKALKTAVYGGKEELRHEIDGMRAAIYDLKYYASHGGTVDAVEVVHGKWIGEADGYADGELVYDVWHCSECDYLIDDGTDDREALPNYCPHCGAKMDGGDRNGL